MIKKINKTYLTVLLLVFFIVAAIYSIKETAIYTYGDGVEYVLMTESFNNHLTPELRERDIQKYIDFNNKYKQVFVNEAVYLEIQQLFTNNKKFLDNRCGFYVSKSESIYSYHFWLYSLINLPIRWILGVLHLDITYTFIITNYLLLLFGIFIVFNSKSINYFDKIWVSLFLICSPIFWYLGWPHPEVFSSVLVFSSLVLFFDKKYYWAMLLISMAASHFPPLFIPTAFMLIYTLFQNGISIKHLVLGGASSVFVIVPSLFYWYHFSIPNLIIHAGFISTEYITLNRLHSFFFDINQGMIVAIPLVLLLCITLFIYRIVKLRFSILDLLLLSVILMSYFYLQMGNWNHGMSVVNRYVAWNAMFVLFYFIWFTLELKTIVKTVILSLALLFQLSTIYYFSNNKVIAWDSEKHNAIALWVLNNYPDFYNPDPNIFHVRTNKLCLSSTDTVLVYSRPDSTIMKLMVFENGAVNQLITRGINEEKLASFLQNKSYYQGWLYINKKDLDNLGYKQQQDTLIPLIEKNNTIVLRGKIKAHILGSEPYKELIQKKAIEQSVSFEKALENDVNYLIYVERERLYINTQN